MPRHPSGLVASWYRKKVVVDADNIAEGIKRDSSHCMIAEAVKSTLPGMRAVSVDLATIRFTDPSRKQRLVFLTPRVAQRALVDFDQGNQVEPFSFVLARPAQVLRSARHPAEHPTLPDVAAHTHVGEAVPIEQLGPAEQPVQADDPINSKGVRMGGNLPPRSALSNRGRVRRFGLRLLDS